MSADFFATFFDFTAVLCVFVFLMCQAIRMLPKAIVWYYRSKVELARVKYEADFAIDAMKLPSTDEPESDALELTSSDFGNSRRIVQKGK